mgnify:FL=1
MCDHDAKVAFYDSRVRVARKAYRCLECGALIAPGVSHHYKVGAVYEGGSHRTRFWQAILCKRCERDWSILTDAEYREVRSDAECICYGDLRDRIEQAQEEDWLKEPADMEMYLRWFTPDPEEIGVDPRLLPGGIHPSEAWRLRELPF